VARDTRGLVRAGREESSTPDLGAVRRAPHASPPSGEPVTVATSAEWRFAMLRRLVEARGSVALMLPALTGTWGTHRYSASPDNVFSA
jgi:hypothetical protein